jgi:hypothetical protein
MPQIRIQTWSKQALLCHFKRDNSSSLLMLPSDFSSALGAVAAGAGAGGSTRIFCASSPYLQRGNEEDQK